METPFNKPTLPEYDLIHESFEALFKTGMVTNGPTVRQFEATVETAFQVGTATAVSCCTSGLMLALGCLGLTGKVALPSFTFFASAHAVLWNGLEPVFVDVEPETWNISPESLGHALAEDGSISAVLPVHVFGNPCDVEVLETITSEKTLSVVYDSAHAMGAKVGGSNIGTFGDAEVFSLSPTKLVVAGEGGIVTTDNPELAKKLKAGRDYGNTGDYDPAFAGLNARMSEFHAAIAIESFKMLEQNVTRRNEIAARYTEHLSRLSGISFQKVEEGNRATYKDFTVLIDPESFGMDRDALAWYLASRGIDSRKYYHPPVHKTKAYWERWGKKYDEYLPVTNRISKQTLSLPMWSHMEFDIIDTVVGVVNDAHHKADEINAEFQRTAP